MAQSRVSLLPIGHTSKQNDDRVDWKFLPLASVILSGAMSPFSQDASPIETIEVLWAVILREYIGSDNVCFSRVCNNEEVTYLRLDLEGSASSSTSHSLSSLLCARRNLQHPFSLQIETPGIECDTMIWAKLGADDDEKIKEILRVVSQHITIVVELHQGNSSADSLGRLWYRSSVMDDEARNIISTLYQSMRCLRDNYNTEIHELDLLSPENKKLLRQWMPPQDWPSETPSLPEILQTQAQRHPDAIAINAWDGNWTYREAEQESQSIARHLLSIGVEPGDIILLRMEKSKWAVAALIGILMAGAICVPIDIRQPLDRVKHIISSSRAKFMVTTEALRQDSQSMAPSTLHLISVPLLSSHLSTSIQLPKVSSNAIAFVFFTSGSTGIPKGVMQGHRAIYMTVQEISRAMCMDSQTRTFQYSSYSFDVSIGDIFGTFLAAGCVCVPSEGQRLNDLAQTLNCMQATHICITKSTLATLSPDDVLRLRHIIVGGESLTPKQLWEWAPRLRLSTIYGTTESVIWDTYRADLTVQDSPSNIGRAIGPTTWIVDPWKGTKLAPVGGVGELLLGGDLLSKGYLDDPDRTNQAFVDKPAWLNEFDTKTTRLYRTGDLVRYNPDGTIHFLGRKDQQVKINGQRVELGDIEHALQQIFPEEICCAAEIIRPEFRQGEQTVAAFFSDPESQAANFTLIDIRQRLAKLLPAYMIPSLIIPLTSGVPTTSSGKIDRVQLRRLGITVSMAQSLGSHGVHREPSTAQEKLLQRLCAEVLGILDNTTIDMESDFFQIGGSSIRAMQLVALAREQGFQLSVADVFDKPRLTDLAVFLASSPEGVESEPPSVAPFSLLDPTLQLGDVLETAALYCVLSRFQIQDILPVTALQEGMLALTAKDPGSYVEQVIVGIPPMADLRRFQKAYEMAAENIAILRSRFVPLHQAGNRVHMVVIDETVQWYSDSNLARCCERDRRELTCGFGERMVRCSLVVDSSNERYFVWTMHHALMDGWSLSLMLDEIESQYLSPLKSRIVPFQTFVHYLEQDVDYDACEEFWRSELRGSGTTRFPPSLPSWYKPTSKTTTIRHTVRDIEWRSTRVTQSTLVRAAWAILMSQYSASRDVVFGTTVIGRQTAVPGIDRVAGPTIATVPIRVQLDESLTISEYLKELQRQATAMVPYEQLGMQKISKVSPDAEKACSFQALLVIQPSEETGDGPRILKRNDDKSLGMLGTYPVILQCWLRPSEVEFQLQVDSVVLDDVQSQRMLYQLESGLRQLCTASSDSELQTVQCFSNQDISQLRQWNKQAPYGSCDTVLDLIQKQSCTRSEGLAVDSWDGKLTYQQLNLYVARLAGTLVENLDMKKGSRVIVCSEKSYLVVVAFLAVLKAGGIFILVDPSLPDRRIQSIIQESKASIALASETHSARLLDSARTILLNESSLTSAPLRSEIPLDLTDDACIVFTSGSTGKPKAICWDHSVLATTALGLGAQFSLSSSSRVFQFSSYTFDVSIHETLSTLVYGGCLCIPPEQSRIDMLLETIVSFNSNFVILVPSTAKALRPEDIPCLKHVVFCGEPLSQQLARTWSKHMVVYNWYGPAECSLATCCRITESWKPGNIGNGVSTITWIVDPHDQETLMPIGAVGELVVQGPCVASRYANDDARTTASFIKSPGWFQQFKHRLDGRLYKTGDLARYSSDGSLILMGRKDSQVKIRGQRVELEEVHQQLHAALPQDTISVVDLLQRDNESVPMLVAFYTSTHETLKSNELASEDWTQSIQDRLGETLPVYMVPSVFLAVRSFPMTSTGKVDRQALRALGSSLLTTVSSTNGFSNRKKMPSTEKEKLIHALWAEVLQLPPQDIGLNDHFIRLGGNSIDAMRLVATARRQGYSLSVRDIFQTPKLSDQSQRLRPLLESKEVSHIHPFSLLGEEVDTTAICHEAARHCGLLSQEIEDAFPCTPLQLSLLALSLKRPGDFISRDIFHIQADLATFKSAWEVVIAQTGILRTRIIDLTRFGFCQAVINQPVEWLENSGTLEDYLVRDERLSMGLGTPLARWAIIPDTDDLSSFTFVWTIHHSLYDGWSFQRILEQVETAYRGQALQPTANFQGFIKYLSLVNSDQTTERFWREKFDGFIGLDFPFLPSPQYQPRATATLKHRAQSWKLPTNSNATSSTLIRAAWGLVLGRYSGASDIVYGVTVLGRQGPVPGIEDMVGPTIATLPVRVRWSDTETVYGILENVQQDGIDAIPYEQFGLQNIRALGAGPSEACDFRTMLVIQPPKDGQKERRLFMDTVADASFGVFNSSVLMLRCYFEDDTVHFHLDFDPLVIEQPQARRILAQVGHTLIRLSSSPPETKVVDLQLLNDSDLNEIRQWNQKTPKAVNATVLHSFHNIVLKFPTAMAVDAWDGKLTYEQLDQYATKFAHILRLHGLETQQCVPLYFEKSVWTVVAIWGVIKAGGTTVLLEPNQPDDRLRLILKQLDAKMIVTSKKNEIGGQRLLPSGTVIPLDGSISEVHSLRNLGSPLMNASNALYIVFTSGSTGTPKGVVITHGNVCSALKQRETVFTYRPGERVLDGVSYAFDVAWGNILFTLCSGACLCVPSDVNDLANSLSHFGVTICGTISSMARVLDSKKYPALKTLILGGESVNKRDIEGWKKSAEVFNSYGPAECTVSVAAVRLNDEERVHLGRGLGATMWIVDAANSNRLASIGSIGELWLEGPQVGRGYLNEPEKTAAAFIENPVWVKDVPNTAGHPRRFYRTGDLAQYNPDGNIRLVGRQDTQVKLRGQRIELDEVDHHVLKHLPHGAEAVAEIVGLQSNGSQSLVMFVVPNNNLGLSTSDIEKLRDTIGHSLSEALPTYMCPSTYIPMDRLPRLPAGKVDRKRLRAIGATLATRALTQQSRQSDPDHKQPPQTEEEKKLQELWAITLGLELSDIGVNDSFLHLNGGDSISAMRLARLAHDQGLSLSVADIFNSPRLHELAMKMVGLRAPVDPILPFSLWNGLWPVDRLMEEAASRCSVEPGQIEDVLPCTALQEGLLALTLRNSDQYVSREVLKLHDNVDVARLRTAWERVVESTPILRTRMIDLPSGLHQVIVNEPMLWQSRDVPHNFGLGCPLTQWALIENSDGKHLIWTVHHALYDGWSMPRLHERLERAYSGETLAPALSLQPFLRYLSSVDEAQSRAFWLDQFSGCSPPSFPAVHSTPDQPSTFGNVSLFLPKFEWPKNMDVTPTAWFRAAWAILIGHMSNADDITFGATTSGRQVPVSGIDEIIGPTIATVPVRVAIDWSKSIGDFVRQLHQQATEMVPFEHFGLHRLHHLSEDAKQACQFRTLLNVQPAPSGVSNDIWTSKPGSVEGQFNNHPLTCDCEFQKDGILIQLEFDKASVPPEQGRRLMNQLETILFQLDRRSFDATRPLDTFKIISPQDIQEIWQWNSTIPEASPVCLHDMIQQQVQQRPTSAAVDAWDGKLTYEGLDRYSTKLASYLQHECGVGPGIMISLCFEKSMWTVVAIYAVMKAGGAFAMMDITHPEERLRTIARQVNQELILASYSNQQLASGLANRVVTVSHQHIAELPPPMSLRPGVPNSELYVVFTSGSTGTPKGAVITHSNFVNAVLHQAGILGYTSETRVFDFASYSFDIAVSNVLHCLAAGGCMCIPSDAERRHNLAETMERMKVNVIDLTPSVTRTIDPKSVPSLKTLILGGEAAARSDIERWAPYVQILNGIGQAECTVTTTMAIMDPTIPGTPGIGKGVGANTWIVNPNDHNQLTAIGAVGELLVGGPLVGAGYLGDGEKTRNAFIAPPVWMVQGEPGGKTREERLYKTGDLVRYDAHGSLQFIGRKDAQIKIRGQRIELEEVEYHIRRFLLPMEASLAAEAIIPKGGHSSVLAIFVCPPNMSYDTNPGFTVLDHSFTPNEVHDLNSRLKHELPPAMIPFVYLPVSEIPLAPTGKTDRKRLKAIGDSFTVDQLVRFGKSEDKPRVAPRTDAERQMQQLWAQILGLDAEKISINESFIELGGDSISAMRLVTLARRNSFHLNARHLLSSSTLSELARSTVNIDDTATSTMEVRPFSLLRTDDSRDFLAANVAQHLEHPISNVVDVFPVTEFQGECINAALQKPPGYWNYFYIDFKFKVDTAHLKNSCRALAMHLPILRTVFIPYQHDFLQVVLKDWTPDFVEFDVEGDIHTASEAIAREDWQNANAQLGRRFALMMLIRGTNKDTARLVIRMSHALYDGISLDLLVRTLSAAYERNSLPQTASFPSFIRQSMTIQEKAHHYWRKLLVGSSMTRINGSMPKDSNDTPYKISRKVPWNAPMPKGVTPATVLTAYWASVVASKSNQKDVVFGRLVSGRGGDTDLQIDAIDGPCLNVVPTRVRWNDDSSTLDPGQVMGSIQQQLAEVTQFETTALSSIISSCTDWPAGTEFGSVFQYQNIEENPTANSNGVSFRLDVIPLEFRPKQVWVLVKPLGPEIDVFLWSTSSIMIREEAESLFDRFCSLVVGSRIARSS